MKVFNRGEHFEFQQKLIKFYFLKGKVLKEEKIVLTIEFALAIVED